MAYKEVLFGWTHDGYNPISVGWKQHTDSQKTQPVICEYYTLYYILTGTGVYTINHTEYRASKGDMITCIPGDTFSYRTNPNNQLDHIWITFAICGKVENRFLHSYLKALYLQDVFLGLQKSSNMESLDYVRECLNEIGHLTQSNCCTDDMLVYQAEKFIRQQYHDIELSIMDLADYLEVSRFKLVRAFSKVKNMAPMECIIRCRLERACEHIRSRKYSLTEVSQMTGYKNYSTFARVFKKYYDMTPKDYKNSL